MVDDEPNIIVISSYGTNERGTQGRRVSHAKRVVIQFRTQEIKSCSSQCGQSYTLICLWAECSWSSIQWKKVATQLHCQSLFHILVFLRWLPTFLQASRVQ